MKVVILAVFLHVKVLNSPFGAITDAEGNFTCRVPVDVHTLEVSFVGVCSRKRFLLKTVTTSG